MARTVQSRAIGPNTYLVKPLGSRANTAALQEVLRVFGPALGVSAQAFTDGESVLQAAVLAAGGGLGDLCARLPEGAIWSLIEQFGKDCEVKIPDASAPGGELVPSLLDAADDLWTGDRYADQFAWLAFAFEVNYSSFFVGSASVKEVLARVKSAFESSPASVSTSGSPPASTG